MIVEIEVIADPAVTWRGRDKIPPGSSRVAAAGGIECLLIDVSNSPATGKRGYRGDSGKFDRTGIGSFAKRIPWKTLPAADLDYVVGARSTVSVVILICL